MRELEKEAGPTAKVANKPKSLASSMIQKAKKYTKDKEVRKKRKAEGGNKGEKGEKDEKGENGEKGEKDEKGEKGTQLLQHVDSPELLEPVKAGTQVEFMTIQAALFELEARFQDAKATFLII